MSFDSEYRAGDTVYNGTFHADTLHPGNQSDSHDIAVVVLNEPIEGIATCTTTAGWSPPVS